MRTIKRRLESELVQCSCISGGLLSACAAAKSRQIFAMTATIACEKAALEMPVNALANGRWLGRHPEIMRSMPYGHRLLLPVRRVVLARVIFTVNPKSEWGRSHSQKGLHGVTAVVEQAEASSSILEYPPENLGESFQAVFSGIDPDDTRKAQCFPINKASFLCQHELSLIHI